MPRGDSHDKFNHSSAESPDAPPWLGQIQFCPAGVVRKWRTELKKTPEGTGFLSKFSLLLCGVTLVAGNSLAQEVEVPTTSSNAAPIAKSTDSAYVSVESASVVKPAWDFAAEVQTKVTYDDNLFISHDNPQSDVEFSLTPLLAFGWGDVQRSAHEELPFPHRFDEPMNVEDERSLVMLIYAPTAAFFVDHGSENSLNHDGSLVLQRHFSRLDISFISRYQTLSNADLDLGTRVDRTFIDTFLRATYKISDKSSVESRFQNEIHDYDVGSSSVTWQNENFWDYRLKPKTHLGFGAAFGRLEYQRGDSQVFERALARVLYSATQKISLKAKVGLDFRQFDSGKDTLDPIFTLGATYLPFNGTTISLEGSRDVESTAQNSRANVKRTNVSINLSQRFHQFVYLMLAAGYTNAVYETLPGVVAPARTDDVFYIYPSVGFDITKHANLQIGYRYMRDESSLQIFSYADNQATVQLNLSF